MRENRSSPEALSVTTTELLNSQHALNAELPDAGRPSRQSPAGAGAPESSQGGGRFPPPP